MTNDATKTIIDGYQETFERLSSKPEDLETPEEELRKMAIATQVVVVALDGLSHEARARVLEAASAIALDRKPPLIETLMPVILAVMPFVFGQWSKYEPSISGPPSNNPPEPPYCTPVRATTAEGETWVGSRCGLTPVAENQVCIGPHH